MARAEGAHEGCVQVLRHADRPVRQSERAQLRADQSEVALRVPLPGQVRNSDAGYAWPVDVWTRLRRFLVLGSEGGSYYASEWALTRENAQAVEQAVAENGARAVEEIVRVSTAELPRR